MNTIAIMLRDEIWQTNISLNLVNISKVSNQVQKFINILVESMNVCFKTFTIQHAHF